MPSTAPYSTVLVTGANAFYSAAIMDRLFTDGIMINAAVRSKSAEGPLKERYQDKVKVFIVPDITVDNAFNEAIKGCDGVFHVASPFVHDFNDAKTDFLDPAINGALSALKAAATEPKVRRVVLTSSVAACLNPLHPTGFHRPGYTYTEKDWNPLTYEEACKLTAFPPVYGASKSLAEKAVWDFVRSEKRTFDLVSINPCHTWGSYTQHVSSPEKMNFTNSDLSKMMDGGEKELPPTIMPWITDIENVADAHINALYNPNANGRYIIANSPLDFQQVVDIMHKNFANAPWIKNVPVGKPGTRQLTTFFTLDNTRSRKELGVKYGPIENAVVNFCKQYAEDRKRFGLDKA